MDLGSLQLTQSAAAVALLALLLLAESAHPFFDFFRQRRSERGRHALRNLALGLVNGALVAVAFAGLWVLTADWAAARGLGLLNLVALPTWLHVVGAVLLLDLWTYAWHRANHVVPFLWRFHRVHHSDAHMDVTTASRFHTGEIVLSSLLRVPVLVLIGATAWELVLYETLMFAVVQFHHANIGVGSRLDRALRAVIVTPEVHKVHHSRWQPETDSNFSALFSWWDRLFGSFRLRERPGEIEFGLNQFPGEESVGSLLSMPLAPHFEEDPSDAPEASGGA
ncbi:MAG: sterol desaturase family protein [Bacteroidota bacterium]